jgi:hypothetical protein
MNFQTFNKQRKFILISAVAGFIAIFLPWKTLSAGVFGESMSEGINGFHGAGVLAFLVFIIAGIISVTGDQNNALEKNTWLVALACGAIALVCAIVNIVTTYGGSIGFVELGVGFGCWFALAAAIGVTGSAWLFRNPTDNLKEGFDSIKKNLSALNPPSTAATTVTSVKPEAGTIAGLEKLIRLKDAGHITEEEYQNMKSKLL